MMALRISAFLGIVVVCAIAFLPFVTAQCNYEDATNGYSLSWSIVGNEILFDLNHAMTGNFWTGVGFGPGMSDLDFLQVNVKDGQITVVDKTIAGYNMGEADPVNGDNVQVVGTPSINAGVLSVQFKRPLNVQASTGKTLEVVGKGGCYPWNFPINGGPYGKMHTVTPVTQEICDLAKCRKPVNSGTTVGATNGPTTMYTNTGSTPSFVSSANDVPQDLQAVKSVLDSYRQSCTWKQGGYEITYAISNNQLVFELKHQLQEPDLGQWTGVGFGEEMSDMNFIEISKYPFEAKAGIRDIYIDGYKAKNLRSRDPRSVLLSSDFSNGQLTAVFTRDLDLVASGVNVTSDSCTTWQFPHTGGPIGLEHYRDPKHSEVCMSQCGGTGNVTADPNKKNENSESAGSDGKSSDSDSSD